MKDILNFLRLISSNNNREWFHSHKELYYTAKEKFDSIAMQLITEVGKFDTSCKHLTLSDCTYRFYRDMRFSKDKSPYKTHFGVYICPKGKKSLWAGYYFHIEPSNTEEHSFATLKPTNSLLCCGAYMPDNKMLKIIREDIIVNGQVYMESIKKAEGFYLCKKPALKKLPKDIPTSKYDEYIRLKSHLLQMDIDEKFLMQNSLVNQITERFKSCFDFVNFINESISYIGDY
ncbi:MAG: DUF2461 domain-containing protein [Bacteroidales bacterium]